MAGKFSVWACRWENALAHSYSLATSWAGEKGIADCISNILPRWKEGMNVITWGPSWSLGPILEPGAWDTTAVWGGEEGRQALGFEGAVRRCHGVQSRSYWGALGVSMGQVL